eukprot:1143906-Pelagomonas_calceolata.AAC.6
MAQSPPHRLIPTSPSPLLNSPTVERARSNAHHSKHSCVDQGRKHPVPNTEVSRPRKKALLLTEVYRLKKRSTCCQGPLKAFKTEQQVSMYNPPLLHINPAFPPPVGLYSLIHPPDEATCTQFQLPSI